MAADQKITRIVMGILFLLVIAYFAVQATDFLSGSISTTLAVESTVEKTATISGYIARNESVLDSQSGIISLSLGEGERVGVNQEIAMVFTNASAQETKKQLEQLELRLEQLQYAKDVAASTEIALKLDSTILNTITDLEKEMAHEQLVSSYDTMKELKSLILKRDYPTNAEEELNNSIQEVTTQITSLQNTLRSSSRSVTATESGYFSAIVDGYETVLTPSFLESVTVESFDQIQQDPSLESNVGKMLYGSTWYFVAKIEESLRNQYVERSTVSIRFPKNSDREYAMKVERVSDIVNGYFIVVFSCNKYLSELTLVRDTSADQILSTYTGIRIPASALQMNEDGTFGVYCVIGLKARFKPVELIYQTDRYYLVKAPADVSSTLTIREGDEIILSTNNLYDGKVVG